MLLLLLLGLHAGGTSSEGPWGTQAGLCMPNHDQHTPTRHVTWAVVSPLLPWTLLKSIWTP